jgi:hypothetical protein
MFGTVEKATHHGGGGAPMPLRSDAKGTLCVALAAACGLSVEVCADRSPVEMMFECVCVARVCI